MQGSYYKDKRTAVKVAIRAWNRQVKELKAFSRGIGISLDKIEVTKEDSIAAGNCKVGTEMFAMAKGLSNRDSIFASELLDIAIGDVNFGRVKATIAAAARRISYETSVMRV